MKKKFFYYLKKFKVVFFLITLALALYGSYQYHYHKYSNPIKAVQVVLYSTVKLFAFSPTSFVTNEAPLAYELAVWLAPAVTMVGFFSLFKRIYQIIKFNIFHIGKKHILLIGDNDKTVEFIKSINGEKDRQACILICDISDTVDEVKYNNLLTKILRLDFSNPTNEINTRLLKDEKLGTNARLISFEEEPKSYGIIDKLHQMNFWDGKLEIFVETKNYRIKELIEAKMDKLERFDLHYFNIKELLVKKLVEESAFSFNYVEGFRDDWSEKSFNSMEEIAACLGTFNILIVGFSEISEHFLMQITNLLTVNPIKNLSVTVVDNSPTRFRDFVYSKRMIKNVLDFEFINVEDEFYKIKEEVYKRHSEKRYCAGFFGMEDVSENILIVDNLLETLADVPIAVYADNIMELNTVIESLRLRHKEIIAFGDKSEVINKKVIIKEELLQKAKEFNSYYDKVMNELMGWDPDEKTRDEKWMSLSNIKKESSAYQAAHRNTKLKILGKFTEINELKNSPKEIISEWIKILQEKNISEQVRIVQENPHLNFMTALEHKRWNNFYYMRDFVYDEVKDEYKKKHDCLIDDWSEFLESKQREKAIFDTLSMLSIYSDKELEEK